jgi:hypothetical protein
VPPVLLKPLLLGLLLGNARRRTRLAIDRDEDERRMNVILSVYLLRFVLVLVLVDSSTAV